MLNRLSWLFSRKDSGSGAPVEKAPTSEEEVAVQVDRPIEHISDDLFDRAPFAKQIATIVSRRRDPSSLVIGLYGPWGDGKTSTLAMIKEYLQPSLNVITMDYNPWFYGNSTEALTRSFFGSIQNKLEASGFFSRENIGGLMANYGKSIPYVGDAVGRLGEVMTTEALTQTRDKLGAILRKHCKKVVIFIDDIDRLDRSEIQTLFKLVRLSGGFDHTTYVLAFDERIVADALGETYGPREPLAGQRFLEKIVQVPLHLPSAKPEKLRQLMFAACDRVLTDNEIELNEASGSELGNALATAFVHALKTPRQVKLFENAISFAVPLLKGEVNAVDQIQIEALRVFYPNIYDAVRKSPDLLLRAENQKTHNERPSLIEIAIKNIEGAEEEREAIRFMLTELFPRFSTMGYGASWELLWANEKRIGSADYFPRYFTYAVPVGDISDRLIDELLSHAALQDGEAVGTIIEDAFKRDASELLIRKLRSRQKALSVEAVPTLVAEVSARSSAIPISGDLLVNDFVLRQAAILVVDAAARLDTINQNKILLSAAQRADSLLFVCHMINESQAEKRSNQTQSPLPSEQVYLLCDILLRRVREAALQQNLFDGVGDRLGRIIFTIEKHGREDTRLELKAYLASLLAADTSNGVRFIKALAGRSQGSDGIIRVSDITRETYDSIARILEPTLIYESLQSQFGEKIAHAKWREDDHDAADLDRRIADQFAALHLHPAPPSEGVETKQSGGIDLGNRANAGTED